MTGTRTVLPPAVGGWLTHALCDLKYSPWFDLPVGLGLGRRSYATGMTADNRAALALCARCPVRAECLASTLALPRTYRVGVIAAGLLWDARGRPRHPDGTPAGEAAK